MLGKPRKRALEVVRGLSSDEGYDTLGRQKLSPLLAGLAEKRLDETNDCDLVTIRRPAEKDLLSRFLQDHWMFKVPFLCNFKLHN
jgi:hypothetical protein